VGHVGTGALKRESSRCELPTFAQPSQRPRLPSLERTAAQLLAGAAGAAAGAAGAGARPKARSKPSKNEKKTSTA